MESEMGMSIKEVTRLIDWLKANGHTDADATDCIKYIANESEPKPEKTK